MPGNHPPVVDIAHGQNAPVGLCVDACGFLAKPRISVDVAVAAETVSRPLATAEVFVILCESSNDRKFSRRRQRQTPPAMATNSEDEVGPTGVPRRSAAPPPPAGGDSRPTTPSSSIATIGAGRLPMSEPSGRYVWPASFIDRNGMVGFPSTPPEYYAPRATTPRAPTNRIALAAALESTRDRQPLLMTDAHTVPLQDGTVSPVQYCLIGLLFSGLCAAAAWSVRP
ncbi:hypothetical protein MRX96_058145 [Rhipicephalus microplus]